MCTSSFLPDRSVPVEKDIDWEGKMNAVTKLIIGFSGREISKLVLAWQVSSLRQPYRASILESVATECV